MTHGRQRYRSAYRDSILAHLQRNRQHLNAEQIHESLRSRFPRISLGTVYRNLEILVQQGDVNRVAGAGGPDQYEAKREPHYHLICTQCGQIHDVTMPVSKRLEKRAAEVSGFRVEYHHTQFYGTCTHCRAATS